MKEELSDLSAFLIPSSRCCICMEKCAHKTTRGTLETCSSASGPWSMAWPGSWLLACLCPPGGLLTTTSRPTSGTLDQS